MKTIITFRGINLDITFNYQPEEPEERNDSNGTGYPGCAEEIDITEIKLNGNDEVMDRFNGFIEEDMEEIILLVHEDIHKEEDY